MNSAIQLLNNWGLIDWKFDSPNQKHYLDLGGDASLVWNFRARFSDIRDFKGAIHSTKIPTGPTGKSGPPQKVDPFFRNFSGWTEPIH